MKHSHNIETNESVLRKFGTAGGSYQPKEVASVTQRVGKNIISDTPKGNIVSEISSKRAIRTGAFQRINPSQQLNK